MIDFKEIYAERAEQYERLVSREDHEDNILQALKAIRPCQNRTVVEWGAGTGRLTCLLAPIVKQIYAFDESLAMLAVAERKLQAGGWPNWGMAVADHTTIPLPDNYADIALEGWAFGHYVGWQPDRWRERGTKALREMERILHTDGTIILLETLGTGFAEPSPPKILSPFYAWLENDKEFNHIWIRTDFHFNDLAEAKELLGFFFGEAMAAKATDSNYQQFPECTGIWYKRV